MHIVTYGCLSQDGENRYGEVSIVCENETDANAVWKAVQEHPERFDFETTYNRFVQIENNGNSTCYLSPQLGANHGNH